MNCKTPRTKWKRSAFWCWSWQWFLRYDTKALVTKPKIDKRDYIKPKSFCTVKTISKTEKQPTEWEIRFGSHISVQLSSVAQSCPTLCNLMNRSTPGLPVHHQLPEFTQTHVHWVSDAIQPSHPWSSPSPPAPNPSQHQSLFQWVSSSHEVAKVVEFQL